MVKNLEHCFHIYVKIIRYLPNKEFTDIIPTRYKSFGAHDSFSF